MIPQNGDFSPATWAFLQTLTRLHPLPADPDSTIALVSLPDSLAAADEDVASGTYPQTDAHPRQDLSLDAMDEDLPWEWARQLLEHSPQPLVGPSDSTPAFPAVDLRASERGEDYDQALGIHRKPLAQTPWEMAESSLSLQEDFFGQAWRMVEQFGGDRPPASPDEHDAPTRAGSLVVPADEDVASGMYPLTDAHPRQDLSLDARGESLRREEVLQFLGLSPQSLAGSSDSIPAFPAVDGGASGRAEDYCEQAWQMVQQVRGDPFPASPDEYHAFTHADRPQISASAALEADPAVSGLPGEQAVILNETMGASDRAGAKRGRPATEPEEDGRAAQRRRVEVPQPMALGVTEWLGGEHIHADYNRLARDLRRTYPGFAAQTKDGMHQPEVVEEITYRADYAEHGRPSADVRIIPDEGQVAVQWIRALNSDKHLFSQLTEVMNEARKTNPAISQPHTVVNWVSALRKFSVWLQEQPGNLTVASLVDDPGALTALAKAFANEGGDRRVKVAVGVLLDWRAGIDPSLFRAPPYPEDKDLLEQLATEGDVSLNRNAPALRQFSVWLRSAKRPSIAPRYQTESIYDDLEAYGAQHAAAHARVHTGLSDLRRLAPGGGEFSGAGAGPRVTAVADARMQEFSLQQQQQDENLIQSAADADGNSKSTVYNYAQGLCRLSKALRLEGHSLAGLDGESLRKQAESLFPNDKMVWYGLHMLGRYRQEPESKPWSRRGASPEEKLINAPALAANMYEHTVDQYCRDLRRLSHALQPSGQSLAGHDGESLRKQAASLFPNSNFLGALGMLERYREKLRQESLRAGEGSSRPPVEQAAPSPVESVDQDEIHDAADQAGGMQEFSLQQQQRTRQPDENLIQSAANADGKSTTHNYALGLRKLSKALRRQGHSLAGLDGESLRVHAESLFPTDKMIWYGLRMLGRYRQEPESKPRSRRGASPEEKLINAAALAALAANMYEHTVDQYCRNLRRLSNALQPSGQSLAGHDGESLRKHAESLFPNSNFLGALGMLERYREKLRQESLRAGEGSSRPPVEQAAPSPVESVDQDEIHDAADQAGGRQPAGLEDGSWALSSQSDQPAPSPQNFDSTEFWTGVDQAGQLPADSFNTANFWQGMPPTNSPAQSVNQPSPPTWEQDTGASIFGPTYHQPPNYIDFEQHVPPNWAGPPSFAGPSTRTSALPDLGSQLGSWKHGSVEASDTVINIRETRGVAPTWYAPPTRFLINNQLYTAALQSDGVHLTHHPAAWLKDKEWLHDRHITRDYKLLERELQVTNPDLAARTRLVDPSLALLLRTDQGQHHLEHILQDRDGNDTADFLFLPVNNADPGDQHSTGTHWSLLLVDRRDREIQVAYHYDSNGGCNNPSAVALAARLGVTPYTASISQQDNNYDCGVFLLAATRELVGGLAQGLPPDQDLSNLVADRRALQDRLLP
ncbi:Ulp1 family isopeptidase [Mesorhizobium sp. M0983]|uniref:Ulp1 family isopeptidase n=1 Tax=Mesorhizobium sp. M0983 TaxID=2957040 RepID=UPI003337914D